MEIENKAETERIKKAYARRDSAGKPGLYSRFNPASLFILQQREREILGAFSRAGLNDLSGKKVLDVGCGNGGLFMEILRYGASPEDYIGIDLLPDRIEDAKKRFPHVDFRQGNVEHMQFEEGFFDLLLCFTVFTSVLDAEMKHNIAAEMIRVTRPGGVILWYDYHMNNPKNPDVRGVKKKEIFELFPGCDIRLRRVTLAPPVVRGLVPFSATACYLLEKLKVLNTHYIGVIRPR